jgi:hypothetical protein
LLCKSRFDLKIIYQLWLKILRSNGDFSELNSQLFDIKISIRIACPGALVTQSGKVGLRRGGVVSFSVTLRYVRK